MSRILWKMSDSSSIIQKIDPIPTSEIEIPTSTYTVHYQGLSKRLRNKA